MIKDSMIKKAAVDRDSLVALDQALANKPVASVKRRIRHLPRQTHVLLLLRVDGTRHLQKRSELFKNNAAILSIGPVRSR